MRAIGVAAVLGVVAAATSAYAQGQSSTSLAVSVQVVRSCTIASPTPGVTAPLITAQCSGSAAPRTQLSAPTRVTASAPRPAPPATTSDERAFRVLTVNF